MGNYADGHNKVTDITKSLGQTYYKLDEEAIPYPRADIHLIRKKQGLPYESKYLENFDNELEKDNVSKDVNDRRNIQIGQEEQAPELKTESFDKQFDRMAK